MKAISLLTALGAMSMLGCAPALNWREMPAADDHLRALFPSKPASATRDWKVQDKTYRMTLTAARVGGAQFAAGYVPGEPGQTEALARQWAQTMLTNIKAPAGTINTVKPVQLAGAQGAFDLAAQGVVEGAPGLLHARFAWTSKGALATIALGQTGSLSADDAQTFAASMKPQ